MQETIQVKQYSAASEVTVLAVCAVMLILLIVSFKVRTKSFRIFAALLWMLISATIADLVLHYLIENAPETPLMVLYGLRSLYHVLLFGMFHHYTVYACEATALSRRRRKPYIVTATVLFILFSVLDAVSIFSGRAMHIVSGAISTEGTDVFTIGYTLFVILLSVLLINVRKRLYRQVTAGFFAVMVICLALLIVSRIRLKSSYMPATFLFPLIAVMYLLHSNPYDALLGANDVRGLNNLIRYNVENGKDYLFLSLYIRELDESGSTMSEEMRTLIRHVAESYFRRSVLFQVSNGHMLLLVPKSKNPDWEARTEKVLEQFRIEHERFRHDYKLVIGESTPELNRKNDYIGFIRSVHARIPENTIYRVKPEDLNDFRDYEAILKEVADIAAKKDPEDPRVLVYCQPVYNIRTGKYDTAEALMRLQPDGMGIVYPDRFIPLAEENGYIHVLTEIILSKTCRALRELTAEGYRITRISVNVSPMELRDQDFCGDIKRIISRSGVGAGMIAIELTETRNESDFLLMKTKIEELKAEGITFYLDDFGTGYSNMERILELPLDIIKFDRSMVAAGAHDKRSEQVIGSLADMFSKLDYSVLYEGVENEKDEEMCLGLSASYLQGYKYSRPVPISELKRFLEKE